MLYRSTHWYYDINRKCDVLILIVFLILNLIDNILKYNIIILMVEYLIWQINK